MSTQFSLRRLSKIVKALDALSGRCQASFFIHSRIRSRISRRLDSVTMTFTAPFKCPSCNKTDRCEKVKVDRPARRRFLNWFKTEILNDPVTRYMEGPYEVQCVKCGTRRPELEKRDYVTR